MCHIDRLGSDLLNLSHVYAGVLLERDLRSGDGSRVRNLSMSISCSICIHYHKQI